MSYYVLKKKDSKWLSVAAEINKADWKAAKYLAKKMINYEFKEWEGIVIAEGFQGVYIVTQHVGLYEKWGYSQIDEAEDKFGRSMRVLEKNFNTISVVE